MICYFTKDKQHGCEEGGIARNPFMMPFVCEWEENHHTANQLSSLELVGIAFSKPAICKQIYNKLPPSDCKIFYVGRR